jgi:hypothetical protein
LSIKGDVGERGPSGEVGPKGDKGDPATPVNTFLICHLPAGNANKKHVITLPEYAVNNFLAAHPSDFLGECF